MSNKIIRTICFFTDVPAKDTISRLSHLQHKFEDNGFAVQTVRIATSASDFEQVRHNIDDEEVRISLGSLSLEAAKAMLPRFHTSKNINFNIELAQTEITIEHVNVLLEIIRGNPVNTFNFTYLFNGVATPYFPSAIYGGENGFAVGMQPTDLAAGCTNLQEWLDKLKEAWIEIARMMSDEPGFLGIDSSIAPLFEGKSSLVNFIKRLGINFPFSATTDTYTTISSWIKTQNPKPYGLNGLMLPCLEDFELAEEYSKGEFTIERNIYLSLHSGLGIDTYPIGLNEDPKRLLGILRLVKALSNKYKKPLSVRFVSDGKAMVGQMSDFKNRYLKDVIIRGL